MSKNVAQQIAQGDIDPMTHQSYSTLLENISRDKDGNQVFIRRGKGAGLLSVKTIEGFIKPREKP